MLGNWGSFEHLSGSGTIREHPVVVPPPPVADHVTCTVRIPCTTGLEYLIDGTPAPPGTYSAVDRSLEIGVRAVEGHRLAIGRDPLSWCFDFGSPRAEAGA